MPIMTFAHCITFQGNSSRPSSTRSIFIVTSKSLFFLQTSRASQVCLFWRSVWGDDYGNILMIMMMVMMIMMAAPRRSFKQWSLLTICFYLLSFHQNWHQDIWRNKPRPWDIKENCSKLFRWHCLFFSSNDFNFWSKLLSQLSFSKEKDQS